MSRIDVNADLGEGLARYSFGHDAEMMKHVSSVSIACGWHAGDPTIMRESVARAADAGVAIGAHVSFPDVLGFGTHRMVARPDEIRDWTMYQAGALQAFAQAEGVSLQHVKPHGALYYMSYEDHEVARAVVDATRALGEGICFVSMGPEAETACREVGVPFVCEGFADMTYGAPWRLVPGVFSGDDAEVVAERAVRFAKHRLCELTDGSTFTAEVDTVCVHGHLPNSGANARRVCERLEGEGIEMMPMRSLVVAEEG
jgi:UPF0271 protein